MSKMTVYEDWKKIRIKFGNDALTSYEIVYNC